MMIEEKKLKRFIEDDPTTFFYYELKHGSQWRRTLDDLHAFDQACKRLNKEIKNNVNAKKEELFMLTQIQEHKILFGWRVRSAGLPRLTFFWIFYTS